MQGAQVARLERAIDVETGTALIGLGALLFTIGIVLPKAVRRREELRARNETGVDIQPPALPTNPSIDVIIPAYLEASVIGNTVTLLRESLALYAGQSNIVVVASDAETAEASRLAGVDRVLETARNGKAFAANEGARTSVADIIVFTDANCKIGPERWPEALLSELGGWHLVSANKREQGRREAVYWQLEEWLKRQQESSLGTLSVVGEFLALRRVDYVSIPVTTVLDDQWLAIALLRQGKKSVVSSVIHTNEPPVSNGEQWERRVRIASGLFMETLPKVPELSRTPEGRILVGHKLYRVTIGATGFWIALAGLALVKIPFSLGIIPIAGALGLHYSGLLLSRRSPGVITTVVGMQMVPIGGALRAFRRRVDSTSNVGWKKVAR